MQSAREALRFAQTRGDGEFLPRLGRLQMQTSSEFLCAWVITLESFTRRVKAFEWHNELLLHAYKVSRSDPIMKSEIISRTSRTYGRW